MSNRLKVIKGPDRGKTFLLKPGEQVAGRDENNELWLSDLRASRAHFKLAVQERRVELIDLGSRNQTLLNGAPVQRCQLRPGDVIEAGETQLEFLSDAKFVPATTTMDVGASVRGGELERRWSQLEKHPSYRRAHRDLAALYRVGNEINRLSSPKEIAVFLLDELLQQTPSHHGVVLLRSEARESSYPIATRHRPGRPDGPLPKETVLDQVLREKRGILYRELAASDETAAEEKQATPPRTALCAPLTVADRVVGWIHLASSRQHAFTEDDLYLATAMAAQAGIAIENARTRQGLLRENTTLRGALVQQFGIVGKSKPVRKLLEAIRKVARTDATALIAGESGTGKELVAGAIHYASERAGGPFVCLNCGAIPENLIESELFGHEKGAFTGATERKTGHFERADGGTLFLDEVSELSQECQVRFLRVLETGCFRRVGGKDELQVDVRVLAATNRELAEAVRQGQFREDLYFRLNVFPLRAPPLRERREDIPLLAEHFLRHFLGKIGKRIRGFDERALQALRDHSWPGNVRELKNLVERSVVLAEGELIRVEELGELPSAAGERTERPLLSLAELEQEHILEVLELVDGNKKKAAEALGIDRSTLYAKLAKMQKP